MSAENGNGKVVVQVVVVGEVEAFRRMREAQALAERLEREREIAKAGGPPPSRW